MTNQEIAEPNTILRATVGSVASGINVGEGLSDRDEMGVCLEPPEYVVGLRHFEQWAHRTAPEGARSGPGDLDLTVYSARKFVRLVLTGNPTILLLLFTPEDLILRCDHLGRDLLEAGPTWIGRNAGKAFLGYLTAQKQRLVGERGQKDVNRPELVTKFGFDTKYASHMIRLGLQGIELMQTGRISLPMPPEERQYVRDIREGKLTLDQVFQRGGELEKELRDAMESSPLPDRADEVLADRWLIDAYTYHWGY